MSRQQSELERVRRRIGPIVLRFLRERGILGTFHATDLHEYVSENVGLQIAPASADRILRALRLSGDCDYIILDRYRSYYQIVSLR